MAATDTGNHTSYAMLKHGNILFVGEAYTTDMFFYSGLILIFWEWYLQIIHCKTCHLL